MAICAEFTPGCYGCEARAKGINLSSSASPTMRNKVPPRTPDPAWERGVAGEHRPDGSYMPYLNPDGTKMRVKAHMERRHEVEAQVKRLKSDPTVFSNERGNS